MRYSYEYKNTCVELYCEGECPETPYWAFVNDLPTRDMVRIIPAPSSLL